MLNLAKINNTQSKTILIDRSSLLVLDYNRVAELECINIDISKQQVYLTDLFNLEPNQITDILTKDNFIIELAKKDIDGHNTLNQKYFMHVTQFKSSILLICRDKKEINIEQLKHDLSSILENIPLGIVYLDSHGYIRITNLILAHFLGDDSLIQDKYFFDLPILVTSGLKQYLQPCLSGEHINLQSHQYNFDEQEKKIIVSVEGVPISNKAGNLISILIIFEDVSERAKLTQRLIKSHQVLENQNKELKRLSIERVRYFGTASHELKTPLVAIAGFVGLLLENKLGELPLSAIEAIEIIAKNTDRLKTIINDILDHSQLESGQYKLNITKIENVNLFMNDLINEIKTQYSKDSIFYPKFKISNNVQNISIFGDQRRLCHVFKNIIDNAIKFRKPNAICEIEISSTKLNHAIDFSIKDNGIGIDPDMIPQAFMPFNKLSVAYDGMGLGLTVCKGIIESHGGTMWLDSEGIGKGTTAKLILPILHD